jgi:hypothetical protein
MHKGRCLIDCGYQKLHKPVDHILVVVVIADFEGVVEKNVGCGKENGSDYRLFVSLALQPISSYGLLVPRGFVITHNDTLQSVGLLWTNDQLVAETST